MSDNASVLAHYRNQGGTVSHRLCQMASVIAIWAECHSIYLEAQYIPGKKNILADQLSRPDQIFLIEWSLLPHVFDEICWEFGRPHLDLFATRANTKLPIYVSLVPDMLAWKTGHPTPSLQSPQCVRFSPVHSAPLSHLTGQGVQRT